MFTDVLQNSLKDLSEIEIGWLEQLAPHFYEFGTVFFKLKVFLFYVL